MDRVNVFTMKIMINNENEAMWSENEVDGTTHINQSRQRLRWDSIFEKNVGQIEDRAPRN